MIPIPTKGSDQFHSSWVETMAMPDARVKQRGRDEEPRYRFDDDPDPGSGRRSTRFAHPRADKTEKQGATDPCGGGKDMQNQERLAQKGSSDLGAASLLPPNPPTAGKLPTPGADWQYGENPRLKR